jgi:hypothetical protein
MDHVHVEARDLLAMLGGQVPHPRGELRAGVRARVVVHDLGELVVSRVGVATAAVLVAPADGDVVVAGDALHAVPQQQGPDCVAVGAEPSEVAEAEDPVAATRDSILEHRLQRERVRVHAAANREPRHGALVRRRPAAARACWSPVRHAGVRTLAELQRRGHPSPRRAYAIS